MQTNTTQAPRLVTFDTEAELEGYVEGMNQAGIRPDLGIVDANGVQVLACRTAPGGDGYDFVYYAPNEEDGTFHCCGCSECGRATCQYRDSNWRPRFPVSALVVFDVQTCACIADGNHPDCPVHPS
ncbi:hypothetical protein [Mycolicibacterium peregrinum]|uniref:hypothetical protein n=1 Tax=Mycolicibacterium peregrinum TaxID=43304 RepID=UPI003AAE6D27